MTAAPSASFVSSDEVHRVSLSPRIDKLYLFMSFAMMVARPGWNIVLTFHVSNWDVDFGERRVSG